MSNKDRHLSYYIFRISKFLKSEVDNVFFKKNINPGQIRILMLLLRRGNMFQNEIASIIMLKPATVTDLVKKLEDGGFVNRKSDKNDKRIIIVSLTRKGKKQAVYGYNTFQIIEDNIKNKLSEDDFDKLYILLKNLHSEFGLDE